jgi:hypothetical protein
MKAMISQPMRGMTNEKINEDRDRAIAYLESQGYEVVNTLFTNEWYSDNNMKERGVVHIPICFLAKSLENMSKCDVVYFLNGWDNARGCQAEEFVSRVYGVKQLFEKVI